jgi:phage portal protein BeeE
MRDMQFEQLRRFSRETFRQAYGFPKPLLGDVEDVNRANAEAAEVVFSRCLRVARLNRWRTMLNDDFLPLFGPGGVEFDYANPIPAFPEMVTPEPQSATLETT